MSIQDTPDWHYLRRLIIIRHGETEVYSRSDHQRALTSRGVYALGHTRAKLQSVLEELSAVDDLEVWVSDARRAQETWTTLERGLDIPPHVSLVVRRDAELYLATQDTLYQRLIEADLNMQTSKIILIIGHNPGLSDLVSLLTCRPHTLDTGALVALGFEDDRWVFKSSQQEIG